MIHGDTLKAKVLRTSVEHRREVSRLGVAQAKAREAHVAHRVSEERFWKEVSRAASERSRGGEIRHTVSLDRAREAARLMGVATSHRKRAERDVIIRVGSALRTEAAGKLLASMQKKEGRRRANQIEERRGEEIQELAGVRAFLVPRAATHHGVPCQGVSSPSRLPMRPALMFEESFAIFPAPIGQPAPVSLAQLSPPPTLVERGAVKNSPPSPYTLVRAAEVQSIEGVTELRISCESRGAQIACRVVDGPGSEVGIILESSSSEISSLSLTGKLALASRLRALGINVHRLDVRPDVHAARVGPRPGRKKPLHDGEGDENDIT